MFWINFGAVLFYLMADILIWMCDVTALAKLSAAHSSPVYVPPREEIMEPRLWRSIMSHVTIPKVNKFECFKHHKIFITECMLLKIHRGTVPKLYRVNEAARNWVWGMRTHSNFVLGCLQPGKFENSCLWRLQIVRPFRCFSGALGLVFVYICSKLTQTWSVSSRCKMTCFCYMTRTIMYSVHVNDFESPWLWDVTGP